MVPSSLARHHSLTVTVMASVALVACGDLKNAGPSSGGTGDAGGSGAFGPGDKGSLPSGYCCTADTECRDRRCVAVGSGGRMCLDTCVGEAKCKRRDLSFTCSGKTPGGGFCQPPDAAFRCLPQTQYERGARQVGECCAATGDGNAGEECEGNQCIAIDEGDQNNPFVCSHWCDLTKECPSGTVCSQSHDCVPANRPYTCR